MSSSFPQLPDQPTISHTPPPWPKRQSSNFSPFSSAINYLTEPVSYTVSGVLRRMSIDEAPTPLARALSANYNGSMTDPSTGYYQPPPPTTRRLSPFQPPPLTPLTLAGYTASTSRQSRLLSKSLAEEIRLLLPPRLQLLSTWSLTYSLAQHGSALSTLYALCSSHSGKRGGFVLVIRDAQKGTFGAYLSDAPRPHPSYYGSGECFLWRAFRLPALPDLSSLPPPPSEDTTHAVRMTTIGALPRTPSSNSPTPNGSGTATPSEAIRFKAFPYTGLNDFSIYCETEFLSVGGGEDGKYGLWLDQDLRTGISEASLTFGNEGLSEEGRGFGVVGVELWWIGG
nr:hypothetical protein B0A51_15617 [Rachicladosporium sp. CCFEE 5018]